MGFLERWGVEKITFFYEREAKKKRGCPQRVNTLFLSTSLGLFTFLAFMVGFVMTLPIIYVEVEYGVFAWEQFNSDIVLAYLLLFVLFVFLEFYLLFLLGFYLLAKELHHIVCFYHQHHTLSLKEQPFLAMLVRTIMELPEPQVKRYAIDHRIHFKQERHLFLWTLLYKVKVIMTNLVLKFIAKRVLTRTSLRIYTPYISAVGTALWDGIVFYKTLQESHYKIVVRLAIEMLYERKHHLLKKEAYWRVLLARYLYYGEYHHNLEYLIDKLSLEQSRLGEVESFVDSKWLFEVDRGYVILLYAFKALPLNKKEKEVLVHLGVLEEFKALKEAFKKADISTIEALIDALP